MAGKANLTFGGRCRIEPRLDFGVYSSVHVKRCVALNCTSLWRSWTYEQTRQSDSFVGQVEGQIESIVFVSIGAPLYKHERRESKTTTVRL